MCKSIFCLKNLYFYYKYKFFKIDFKEEYFTRGILMDWLNVNNIEDIKKFGTLNEVKKIIKNDLKVYFSGVKSKDKNIIEMISVKSSSWIGLLDKIKALKIFVNEFSDIKNNETYNSDAYNDDYFKSKTDEYIFYLLEMDGKQRAEKLKISRNCYLSISAAKKWRNKIAKELHPDKSNHKKATQAAAKLNQLYKEMIGYE